MEYRNCNEKTLERIDESWNFILFIFLFKKIYIYVSSCLFAISFILMVPHFLSSYLSTTDGCLGCAGKCGGTPFFNTSKLDRARCRDLRANQSFMFDLAGIIIFLGSDCGLIFLRCVNISRSQWKFDFPDFTVITRFLACDTGRKEPIIKQWSLLSSARSTVSLLPGE